MSDGKDAVLIRLGVSQWGGERLDREASKKLAQDNNAAKGAVKAIKHLVPQNMLQDARHFAGALRRTWTDATAPWLVTGMRVTPCGTLLRTLADLNKAKQQFLDEADKVERAYSSYLTDGAAKQRLGNLYDAKTMPTPGAVRAKYKVEIEILPVPMAEEWRIAGVVPAVADRLKSMAEGHLEKANARVRNHWRESLLDLVAWAGGIDELKRVKRSPVERFEQILADTRSGHLGDLGFTTETLDTLHTRLNELKTLLDEESKSSKIGHDARKVLAEVFRRIHRKMQ